MHQQKNLKVTDSSSCVEYRFGYKDIMALASLIMIIILIILAVNFKSIDELVDPDISIEVTGSWYSDGPVDDQLPVEEKKWVVLDVNISNSNEDSDFQVSVPHFYGRTGEGDSIWVFNSEDYDQGPIGPGENTTVRLVFQIPIADQLSRLEYIQRLSGPVTCDVPIPEPYPTLPPE